MFKRRTTTKKERLLWSARNQLLISAVFVALVGLPGLWLLWATKGVQYFERELCLDEALCSRLGQVGDLFGGVNALYAGLAFTGLLVSIELSRRASKDERQRALDKELVEQIRQSYEWAFEAIRHNEKELSFNRQSWLRAARHIVRAQSLQEKICGETYQLINQEDEEFWRNKFFKAINDGGELAYLLQAWMRSPIEKQAAPVSISVIVGFSAWRDSVHDPLDYLRSHLCLDIPSVRSMPCYGDVQNYLQGWEPGQGYKFNIRK